MQVGGLYLKSVWGLMGTLIPLVAASPLAKFEPEQGCYIGAFVLRDRNIGGDMSLFQRLTGKAHASYLNYVGYGYPFPASWVEEVKQVGAIPHIAFEPNQGLPRVRKDNYLREWAYAARRARCPIFLRFASEMNGSWQNYSGDPELYIRKWRLIHEVMEEIAPNVAMVWAPYCTPTRSIPSYYPGDEYVDWVGVNFYSVHHHNNDINQPSDHEDPRSLLRYVYDRYSSRKPIMIGEYAATNYCLACRQATVNFALGKMERLYLSLSTEFPRVKMINWFNWDTIREGAAKNNYALTTHRELLQRYHSLISSPYFLSQVPYPKETLLPPETEDAPGSLSVAGKPARPILPPLERIPPPTLIYSREEGRPPRPASDPLALSLSDRKETQILLRPQAAPASASPSPTPRSKVGLAGLPPGIKVSGKITLRARIAPEIPVAYVLFRINGEPVKITNYPPFQYLWNTTRFPAGEHTLQVAAIGSDGREEPSVPVKVTVHHE